MLGRGIGLVLALIKINRRRIDILKLEEVDILVYDFKLTKKDTLRSKTIEIMNKFLSNRELQDVNLLNQAVDPEGI